MRFVFAKVRLSENKTKENILFFCRAEVLSSDFSDKGTIKREQNKGNHSSVFITFIQQTPEIINKNVYLCTQI